MYLKIVEMDLRRMRIGRQYKGHRCVMIAEELCLENGGDPLRITKDLYPEIAERMQLNPQTVEQDIAYVAWKCWENDRAYLMQIAGYELARQPSNQEFIDILVNHALRADEACAGV